MTQNLTEYQAWLATLTPDQRAAVAKAVGVVMDMLLALEGRMSVSEAEVKAQWNAIREQNKRIEKIERYLCFPERPAA